MAKTLCSAGVSTTNATFSDFLPSTTPHSAHSKSKVLPASNPAIKIGSSIRSVLQTLIAPRSRLRLQRFNQLRSNGRQQESRQGSRSFQVVSETSTTPISEENQRRLSTTKEYSGHVERDSEPGSNGHSEQGTKPAEKDTAFSEPFPEYIAEAVARLRPEFEEVDRRVAVNLRRVLDAYRDARVGSHHMTGSTGYGHNDAGGRDALDRAFATIAGAEAAIVRSQFFSGTHAIAAALFAVLRPGDELLAVAGPPYDTLEEVIGLRGTPGHGSLAEFGVSYRVLPLNSAGKLDFDALASAVTETTKCALIQRSCGYSWRETLTMDEIAAAVAAIKKQTPACAVVVDNCYGEFVDTREPTAVGADLIAGSLIKNPGGSIAPGGGYVAGREDLVDAAAARLSAPGIGREAGATPSSVQRLMLQGLFLAPQIVGEAVKSSLLLAEVLSAEGFATKPAPRVPRHDIIQAVQLGSREKLLAFCQAVQTMCPVGAYIKPTAGATAGYESEVVFADGTFIDGSTIELSCDGPLREPFVVYCQGGTHWTHWAIALDAAVTAMRALK